MITDDVKIYKALANVGRLRIVRFLEDSKERTPKELCELFDIIPEQLSRDLRQLKNVNIISIRKDGRQRKIRLNHLKY